MSTDDSWKNIREGIKKIGDQSDEAYKMLSEAIDTIKSLQESAPKIVSDVGATLCKAAETMLPNDKVIIIKSNPAGKYTLHLIGFPEAKLSDVVEFLKAGYIIADNMQNEDGVLESKNDKPMN